MANRFSQYYLGGILNLVPNLVASDTFTKVVTRTYTTPPELYAMYFAVSSVGEVITEMDSFSIVDVTP